MKQMIMLFAIWTFISIGSITHAGIIDIHIHLPESCVSGKMKVSEQTKGYIPISKLAKGDVIRGVTGSEKKSAWCKVEAVFLVAQGQNQTTYDGFTADHMVVDKTVHRYGNEGQRNDGPIYTLSTDCDAAENSAGQLFTPISTTFCRHELTWSEYLSLIAAIRRVTARTGNFWYDLNAYHDNDTASVPRWVEQLPPLCEELLRCARKSECQKFEFVTARFVHEHLNVKFAQVVDRAFPHLGGNLKKSESGTVSEVVSPKKQSYTIIITCSAVGGIALALLMFIAIFLYCRRSRARVSKKLQIDDAQPNKSQPPGNVSLDHTKA
ncbi:uncharacterized protein LOC116295244 [Actinia tenebrosa]|uniref:Uncharacterized protein LOC116295244 n=1 Tax=Actinia tenebrosa TaxID=6105 RepID=A0A6P8HR86_ACTTE|nr:uncharacterized protein LOC116295244 [Actinia tenebrosa]